MKLLPTSIFALALSFATQSCSPPQAATAPHSSDGVNGRWRPGYHYVILVPPRKTAAAPGKVEVIEFFSYACGSCYRFEPYLQKWLQHKPTYIDFSRVAAIFDPRNNQRPRLFYTLEALGRSDLHAEVFKAIHVHHNDLLVYRDDKKTFELQLAFAKAHGIEEMAFRSAYYSAQVDANLERAMRLTNSCEVTGFPTMVVNGKFKTDAARAGGDFEKNGGIIDWSKLTEIVGNLAASERRQASTRIADTETLPAAK